MQRVTATATAAVTTAAEERRAHVHGREEEMVVEEEELSFYEQDLLAVYQKENEAGTLAGCWKPIRRRLPRRREQVPSFLWLLLLGYLPFLRWLPAYKTWPPSKAYWRYDLLAGLTHGVMVIPQGMAYATVAGLPPSYGLYTAFLPPLIYLFFGSSPQLVVGPTAVLSLMVGSAAASFDAAPGTEKYLHTILIVTFMVGVMELVLGLLKIGFLADFLSHPLITGFTGAAGILIAGGQVHTILGVSSKKTDELQQIISELLQHIDEIQWWSVLMGALAILFLFALKAIKWTKHLPGPFLLLVFTTFITWSFDLNKYGIAIVGDVPQGMPNVTAASLHINGEVLKNLFFPSVVIAIVAFIESISVARTFAIINGYEIDSNQELVALGLSNIGGAFFSCYPATGSFSRTAVNARVGAKSAMSNLIGAIIVLFAMLFLTPLLYYLPNTILAAIIINATATLLNFNEARFIYKTKKLDFLVLLVAFLGTLFLGIKYGILVAFAVSVLIVLWNNSMPSNALLGYFSPPSVLPSHSNYFPHRHHSLSTSHWYSNALSQNNREDEAGVAHGEEESIHPHQSHQQSRFVELKHFQEARCVDDGVILWRIRENLYFVNAMWFKAKIRLMLSDKKRFLNKKEKERKRKEKEKQDKKKKKKEHHRSTEYTLQQTDSPSNNISDEDSDDDDDDKTREREGLLLAGTSSSPDETSSVTNYGGCDVVTNKEQELSDADSLAEEKEAELEEERTELARRRGIIDGSLEDERLFPLRKLRTIIIDFATVNWVDTTALHAIEEMQAECCALDVTLAFVQVNRNVGRVMYRGGLLPQPSSRLLLFASIDDALLYHHHHTPPINTDDVVHRPS
ncbi:Solute carrier 26 family protein [Balamuthia mandrillaris]